MSSLMLCVLRVQKSRCTHFLLCHTANFFLVVFFVPRLGELLTLKPHCCVRSSFLRALARVLLSSLYIHALSAQTLQKNDVDHIVITFCTSSGHVSLKFMFLLSGDTITSHLGHLNSYSSSCNLTELPGRVRPLQLALIIVVILRRLFCFSMLHSMTTLAFCGKNFITGISTHCSPIVLKHSLKVHCKPARTCLTFVLFYFLGFKT